MLGAGGEHSGFVTRGEATQVGHTDFDETNSWLEMVGGIGEAGHLLLLGGQVHDGVVDQVDQ